MLGVEINIIDALTGATDRETASLKNLNQARREEITLLAKKEKALAAQTALLDIDEQLEKANQNLENLKYKQQVDNNKYDEKYNNPYYANNIDSKLWDSQVIDIKHSDGIKQADDIINKLLDKKQEYEKIINSFTEYNPPSNNNKQETTKQQPAQTYKQELDTISYRRNLNLDNEYQELEKLKQLRQKYYGDELKKPVEEHSEELKRLNISIYQTENSLNQKRLSSTKNLTGESEKAIAEMYKNEEKLAKETYDKTIKLAKEKFDESKKLAKEQHDESRKKLDEWYNEEIKSIDENLKAKEHAINESIKAIDKEIEARKRLKQEENYNKKTDSLKAQLEFSKLDDFSRLELEAELKRLEEEQADYKWELEQQNKKDILSEELANAKELAEAQKEHLKEILDIKNQQNQQAYDEQIIRIDTAYQNHLEQLSSIFIKSSNEMGTISKEFADTIENGVKKAAQMLNSMLSDVNSAMKSASSISNVYNNNNNSSRAANVTINNQGYTQSQINRMIDNILY